MVLINLEILPTPESANNQVALVHIIICYTVLNASSLRTKQRKQVKRKAVNISSCTQLGQNLQQSTSLVALNSDKICPLNQHEDSSTFPAVSDVKGLLQVKEVQVKGTTDKRAKVTALCDPAYSHSWIAGSAAARLNLKSSALKLMFAE